MPRGWYRVGTQSGKLSEGNKKRGSVQRMKSNEGKNAKKSCVWSIRLCIGPTSEALTRPSWKEQLDGSWVHKLRYLHQWHRKALFTHDRHLRRHTHTHMQSACSKRIGGGGHRVCQSGGSATKEMSSDRSQVGTCCCCALVVGTEPNSCWGKFSLHKFTAAIY